METVREREMADAIARAEEQDELEESERPYVRPQPPRRVAGDVYTFRLPPDRRDQLRDAANRSGVPPATLIRQWVERQLDAETKRAASVAAVDQAAAVGSGVAGSYAKGSTAHPTRDIDALAEVVRNSLPPDQLQSLMVVGGLLPGLAVVTQKLAQEMASTLSELDEVSERIVHVIGETGLADLFAIRGAVGTEDVGRYLQDFFGGIASEAELRSASDTDHELPGATRHRSTRARSKESVVSRSKGSSRHVVPNSSGGWDVKAPGATRASSHADTQAEAIRRAREIVHNTGGGEVVIHGRDGRIRDSDTIPPGSDPNPPRDRK